MRSITMIFEDTMLKDDSINSTDKLIYGIIGVLSNNKGYCYANNDYLSKQLNLSKRTITNSIGKLKKARYIKVENEKNIRKIYLTSIAE